MNRCTAVLMLGLAATCAAPAFGETLLDRSIPVSGARVLQVATGGGDVTLVPQNDRVGDVRVVVERSGSAPAPRLDSSRSGNRLIVQLAAQGKTFIPFAAGSSTIYRIEYPAGMRVDLRADSGTIGVTDPAHRSSCTIKTAISPSPTHAARSRQKTRTAASR